MLVPRVRSVFSESVKDVQLGNGGPPGSSLEAVQRGASGWRAVTRVLRSCTVRSYRGVGSAVLAGVSDLTLVLLPSDCRVCGAPLVSLGKVSLGKVRVCEDCIAQVGARSEQTSEALCSRCGDTLGLESSRFAQSMGIGECTPCRLAPPEFERALSIAAYDHEMRELLHLLKFEGVTSLARHILGERLATVILQLQPNVAGDLLVVPVPLFAARERQRGYNQATLLAEAAVDRLRRRQSPGQSPLQLRLAPTLLQRVRDTRALYTLSPRQRRATLRGAFRVPQPASVRGREVLLIDDILTTGATANECARVLRRAGATKVWVVTAARARTQGQQAVATFDLSTVTHWNAASDRTLEPDAARRVTF